MAGPRLIRRGAGGEVTVIKEHIPVKAPVIVLEDGRADFVSESNGAAVQGAGNGGDLRIEIRGIRALYENLLRVGPAAMNAAGNEMENILADIMALSRPEVPVLFENLVKSGNFDRYVSNSALIKPPTILQMRCWYGAPPATTQNTEGVSYLQTVDISGDIIESGRTIGHQRTGIVRLKGKHAAESGAVGESNPDPSKYALKQHEELGFLHLNGGKAKYLEDPFLTMEPNILKRLAAAVSDVLGIKVSIYNPALAGMITGG